MDNENTTAEEKLRQLDEERKSLRNQIKSNRDLKLEEAAKMRIDRDDKIDKIREKLNKISEKIYAYNKLGKVAKADWDILKSISDEINIIGGEHGRDN